MEHLLWQLTRVLLLPVLVGGLGLQLSCDVPEPVPLYSRTTVRWQSSWDSRDFWSLPWPDDLRRDPVDGRIRLTGFPNPASSYLLDEYLDQIDSLLTDRTDGFSTNGALYLPLSARLAEPLTQRSAESLEPQAKIILVNLDSDSKDCGLRIPVSAEYFPEGMPYILHPVIAVLPEPGFPLRPETAYGLFLRRGLKGLDGRPMRGDTTWQAALSNGVLSDHPAASVLQDGRCPDGRMVPERSDLVGGSLFTTGQPERAMKAATRTLMAMKLPAAEQPQIFRKRNDGCRELHGRFTAPIFQRGTIPYLTEGGGFVYDETGAAVSQDTQMVRYSLVVPPASTVSGAQLPLVLYAHGTGGDYRSVVRGGVSTDLCSSGVAVVGFDQPLHGDRITEGDPTLLSFNFINLEAMVHNFVQGGLDLVSLRRSFDGFVLPPSLSGYGHSVTFRTPFLFMGHSQGALTGAFYLAQETNTVSGAVFSGSSGGLYLALLDKVEPVNIPVFFEAALSDWGGYGRYSPPLALFQLIAEPSDPINYARYLLREKPSGSSGWVGKHLFISEGIYDEYTPPAQAEAFMNAVGIQWVGPLLKDVPGLTISGNALLERPASANLVAADGATVTAVGVQYESGHFSLSDTPQGILDYSRFLLDLAAGRVPEIR